MIEYENLNPETQELVNKIVREKGVSRDSVLEGYQEILKIIESKKNFGGYNDLCDLCLEQGVKRKVIARPYHIDRVIDVCQEHYIQTNRYKGREPILDPKTIEKWDLKNKDNPDWLTKKGE